MLQEYHKMREVHIT